MLPPSPTKQAIAMQRILSLALAALLPRSPGRPAARSGAPKQFLM